MNDKNPELTTDLYLSGERNRKVKRVDFKKLDKNTGKDEYIESCEALMDLVLEITGDRYEIENISPRNELGVKSDVVYRITGRISLDDKARLAFSKRVIEYQEPEDSRILPVKEEIYGFELTRNEKSVTLDRKFNRQADSNEILEMQISKYSYVRGTPQIRVKITRRSPIDQEKPRFLVEQSYIKNNQPVAEYHSDSVYTEGTVFESSRGKQYDATVLRPSFMAEQILSAFSLPKNQFAKSLGNIKI